MENNAESYKCPNCGSPLKYVPDGELKCDSCDATVSIDTVKKLSQFEQSENEFDWGNYKKEFEKDKQSLENTVVYVCKSCGAEIEADASTSATHCPYCDNEVIISDRLSGGLSPNGIIPFKIDKKGLDEAVKNYFKGRPYLPNNFLSEHKMSKIQGIYVPFWLFDAGVDGTAAFDGTQIRTYSDSRYDYTETSHFLISVDGSMKFEKTPVDASIKMDNELMDSIEPFDYSELVDFNPAYLSGFVADRFDDDPDKSLDRASQRMKESAFSVFQDEANDFTAVTCRGSAMSLTNPKVKYVLLPVYLLNLKYMDKDYRFAINGQTGKIVGELPISKIKQRLIFWGTTFGAAALAMLASHFIFHI